jgi:predicted O-methyltransferase YrrM
VASEIERLQRVIDSAIRGSVTATSDGATHDIFPIAIHPREGEALSDWVARERAASSIEIGFGYGVSALFIFRGLLSSGSSSPFRHLTIDPNQIQGFASIGLQLVEEAGLRDHLDFHNDRSEFVLPRLLTEGRQFDFAFVDGNHRFDAVFVDLMFLGRLVRGGSVIFLDDYQLPAVKKAVAFCTRDLGWAVEEDGAADENHHWVVVRTPAQPRERRFDHFVDF